LVLAIQVGMNGMWLEREEKVIGSLAYTLEVSQRVLQRKRSNIPACQWLEAHPKLYQQPCMHFVDERGTFVSIPWMHEVAMHDRRSQRSSEDSDFPLVVGY
jgi:hypothetical protein